MIASEHRLALPSGYQLGKYRFKGVLGAGGFGITYLADDQTLGRRVAIKELLPNEIATRLDGTTVIAKTKSEESNLLWARDRFLEEGRALAACEHPNVVHVYEMIEANGTAYMVTKYEDGRSLSDWLTTLGRQPTEAELRSILDPLLSGLEKVHRAGFLHRDIKPENIYLTEDGRPLLLDFGSARQAVTDRSALLTSIVTIGYAPYEQYYEDGKQGPWSDIYAMAGVMYRAIQGEKPPEATRRLKNDACVKLAKKYAGQYDPQFLNAIDQALSVEYQDRPQSVVAWRGMLGRVNSALVREQPQPLRVTQSELWSMRFRSWIQLALDYPRVSASIAGLGVVLCGFFIWKSLQPPPEPEIARNNTVTISTDNSQPPVIKSDTNPSPLPPVAIVTPAPAPAPNPGPVNPPVYPPNPGPVQPGPDSVTPDAVAVVDPAIVGSWTTRHRVGSAKNYVVFHWEQLADGHYTSSIPGGPIVDSGVVTAENGRIRRVSSITHLTVDLTYEIKGDNEFNTTEPGDPYGPATWKRVGTTASSGKSSTTTHHGNGNSGNSNSGESSHRGGPDWIQHIPSGIRGRFGF